MRLLPAIVLLALGAHAAEHQPFPPWDGQETLAEYARRVRMEPAKTLDLGNEVKLQLVLIPAGKFTMGTPEPPPVDEEEFRVRMVTGQAVLGIGGGTLLVLLGAVLVRAIRKRRRPQYSLAYLLAMAVLAGGGLLGGMHWHFSARALAEARAEFQEALARYEAADDNEKPAHEATLTRPFYVGRYEVTQGQYQQVMGTNPSRFEGPDLPVETVSWEEAQEFCRKASEKTGVTVRLPTDAEWERACRAGTRTTYGTGDTETDLDRAAWYGRNSHNTTHPVGRKTPNAWGVCDMHGNVWEWCADRYASYGERAATDPQGPEQGTLRVLRGGSWKDPPGACRSADRDWSLPVVHHYRLGLRVAMSAPPNP